MNLSWFRRIALTSAGSAVLVLASLNGQEPVPLSKPAEGKASTEVQPGIQVQDSGPVHEAFAQPGAPVKGPGQLIPKAPPPPVPELPPDVKPEGDHVVWVPGYWHWD